MPVGGGPPARSSHASLRLGVVDLEARPGPAATHRHRSLTHLRALARQALAPLTPAPTPNFARNSPTTASSFELRSLELQRFWALLKLQPIELRASFRRQRRATAHGHRSLAHPTSEPSHAKPLLGPRPSHPAPTSHIPEPTRNFACNSPNTISNLELRSLELQRFQTLSKLHPIELHATFLEGRH